MRDLSISKKILHTMLVGSLAMIVSTQSSIANPNSISERNNAMPLTQEWDKTFPQSDKVTHKK